MSFSTQFSTFEKFEEFCNKLIDAESIKNEFYSLEQSRVIGGASGGDCWGGEAHSYLVETVTDWDESTLDLILEIISPEITYIQYRKISKDIYVLGSRSVNEYYGNHTRYETRTLKLINLYNNLLQL